MAHCLYKNVFTTIVIFLKQYGSHLAPIFSRLAAGFTRYSLASFLSPRPWGKHLNVLLRENFMVPLEREPVSGCMKEEFTSSPDATEETINKILSSLGIAFSLPRAENGMAERPGQTHPPGAPPSGSFRRDLPPLFFTGAGRATGLTGSAMLIVSLFLSEIYSNLEKQHKCAKTFRLGDTD